MTPKASSRPQKPLQDLSTNINFDASAKFAGPNLAHAKEGISSDTTSCISSAGDATNSVKESDEDHESSITEQGIPYPRGFYPGCYYPGYEGYFGELDAQGYHFGGDGMETKYPALQADNGSVIYCMQGYQPGFNPYSPYIPVTTVGVDGQYITQNPMLPSHIALPEYYPALVPYASEFFPSSHLWDSSFFAGDGMHGGGYSAGPDTLASKANLSAHCHARVAPSKFNSPSEFSKSLENKGSSLSLNFSSGHGMLGQLKPTKKGNQPIQTNKSDTILANSRYFYPTSPANVGVNGRGCDGAGTLKTAKANDVSDSVLLNEGHGAANSNCALVSGSNVVGTLAAGGNELRNSISSVVRRDQYNLPDFETKYDHALFFVIKSYSEDDIHKSIKYNVWASTPNGNKRLDSAYQYAQAKMGAAGVKCPVLLFFSVNASGQFCGVAEMTGRVDFTKSMDFWQQDKWNGFFPVKWHIIKDVPNPQLRHVILENNDGKPVTNSRDTQEVRLPQGIEMLKVFKRHASKTSILDDFDFYECREKEMQDQRISLSMPQKVDEAVSKVQSISLSAAENVEQPETGQGAKD